MAEVFDFGLQQHKIKMDGKFFENNLFAVAGDIGRRLEVQLLNSDNMVQSTTGISLRLNANVAGQATYAEATLVDATQGLYELDLPNGMLIAPGNWQFQWQIIGATGEKLHSFAFMGTIGSNLAEGAAEGLNFYLNLEVLKQMQEDFISGAFDSEVLETNIAEKLTDLETQYAPKLTEVTAQLAQTAIDFDFQLLDYAPNVRTLGAKGDGVTDDTAVIQGALNTYGYAFIPKGTFAVSRLVIPDKAQLIGSSKLDSIIISTDPNNVAEVIEIPRSSSYTNIEKISVKGNIYKKANGVVYSGTGDIVVQDSRHRIKDVIISDCNNSLIVDWRCRGMVIEDVMSIRSARKGFTISGSDNVVDKCVSAVSGTDGFYFDGDNNRVSNIKALYAGQNTFNGSGVRLAGCDNSVFTNLDIQENVFDNIYLDNCSSIIMQAILSDGAGCKYQTGNKLTFYDGELQKEVPIANIKFNNVRGVILDGIVFNRGTLSDGVTKWQSNGGFVSLSANLDNLNNIRLTVKNSATDGTFKQTILTGDVMSEYQKRNSLVVNALKAV